MCGIKRELPRPDILEVVVVNKLMLPTFDEIIIANYLRNTMLLIKLKVQSPKFKSFPKSKCSNFNNFK
jgi:hypothetical protein